MLGLHYIGQKLVDISKLVQPTCEHIFTVQAIENGLSRIN